jgi:hypothetical protein
MNQKPENWEVVFTKEQIENLRSDPRFAGVLTLARAVNAIMFCNQALLEGADKNEPSDLRQRMNALLLSAGILFESLDVAEKTAKELGNHPSYKKGLKKLLENSKTLRLRSKALLRLRNQIAFHFDPKVASKTLKELDLPAYQFATGVGSSRGTMYFQLADEVAINYLIGIIDPTGDELKTLGDLLTEIGELMTGYINAAETFIAHVIIDMGGTLQERKQP